MMIWRFSSTWEPIPESTSDDNIHRTGSSAAERPQRLWNSTHNKCPGTADVDITLHDGVEHGLVNPVELEAIQGWLELQLRAAEALVGDKDFIAVRQDVAVLAVDRGGGLLELCLEVECDVRDFSLMSWVISRSPKVVKVYTYLLRIFWSQTVRSLPAEFNLRMVYGRL
jgi:hypothetical protein